MPCEKKEAPLIGEKEAQFYFYGTQFNEQNAMKTKTSFSPPTHAEIAAYAYHLWEAEGRLSGRDLDYWFQAKAHLVADRLYDAGMLEQITPVLLNSPRSPDAPARSKPARSLPEKPAPRGAARRARSPQEERAAA